MAGTAVNVPAGTAVVFGTSSWAPEVYTMAFPSLTRETVEVTKLSDGPAATKFGGRTHIPVDLVDIGQLVLEVYFAGNESPDIPQRIEDVEELITITFPLVVGDDTAPIWVTSGFVTGLEINNDLEDALRATVTIQLVDDIAITVSTAT